MYYQNEMDETLVMLTLAGEQRAYEILVTRYQRAVISSAIRITKNHFMAEDAAQDAANCIWSDEWRFGASPIVEYREGVH